MSLDNQTLSALTELYNSDPEVFMAAVDKINVGTPASSGRRMSLPKISSASAEQLTKLCRERDIPPNAPSCHFRGGIKNQVLCYQAIYKKYGKNEADKYEPAVNVKPRTKWLQEGFVIIEGEKPLCQIDNNRDGRDWKVDMWHFNQVIKG